jgi:hypothetical protein
MSMTGYDYNFDLAIREVGDQVVVTNNLGRTAIYGEIVNLDGMYGIVMEHDGIANGATGRMYVLQPDVLISTAQITAASTFAAGAAIYFKAGGSSAAGTLEDSAAGGAVAIGTIESAKGDAEAHTSVSFRPYSQIVDYGGYDTRLDAVEAVVDGLQEDPGIPFRKTVTLKADAAETPVSIIADAAVGTGKSVYITGFYANVNGAVAWSGTGNNVIVRDRAGSPVAAITLPDSILAADAQLMFGSTDVVLGDGIKDGTGMTPAKGIEIVGDGAFSAGSDLIVTIVGFIGDSPA